MSSKIIEINELKKILPQRFPFLMIDRVIEASSEKVVAIKNVSINEEYFKGHFPGNPVMPGALIIEAMAQAGIVLYRKIFNNSKIVYLGAVKVRFFDSVYPSNQLRIEVIPKKILVSGGVIEATATVDDKKIAQAEITFGTKDNAD